MSKFLANENIPLKSVRQLQDAGVDIKAIGIANPSVSDKEVIELSNKEARTIITFDSDYSELIFKHGLKPKAGVIYFRFSSFNPEDLALQIMKILKSDNLDFSSKMTVIDARKIRQRKY